MVTDTQLQHIQEVRHSAELTALRALFGPHWQQVLGAGLTADDFTGEEAHAAVWTAVASLQEHHPGRRPDMLEVRSRFVADAPLGVDPSQVEWAALAQPVSDPATVQWALDQLSDLRLRRAITQSTRQAQQQLMDLSTPAGQTRAQLAAGLDAAGQMATSRVGAPLTFHELLELPDPPWLIDGIMPAGQTTLFGNPAAGKSWVALTMALSVATGTPWFGHEVDEGPVIYMAGEGLAAIQERTRWLATVTGEPAPDRWKVLPRAFPLSDTAAQWELMSLMGKVKPRLCVVDTWTRYAALGDENSVGEQHAAWQVLDRARDEHGVSTMVVHHSNSEGNIRGRGLPEANADATLFVEKPDAERPELSVSPRKVRRGAHWSPILLRWVNREDAVVLDRVGRSGRTSQQDRNREALEALQQAGQLDVLQVVDQWGPDAAQMLRAHRDVSEEQGQLVWTVARGGSPW